METVSLLQQTVEQMACIEKKDFNQLLTVKPFFERVKKENGASKFQNVSIDFF